MNKSQWLMDDQFEVFDFHRMFMGDAPPVFIFEIVFRTIIMYAYTILLLRLLGKRGMGQMSILELAIIISFGSAVGDPMIGADVPIVHGIVAITVVAIFQLALERIINKNKKVENILEGNPNLVVENGVINWKLLTQDNFSKEDLFRSLRIQNTEHLGQIKKAHVETSGQISILFQLPHNVKPGLSIMPKNEISKSQIVSKLMHIPRQGIYCCMNCGYTLSFVEDEIVPICDKCSSENWTEAITTPRNNH